jgi:hypothetical protein
MMRNGVLWERITSPLLTNETESGYWLTPTCTQINERSIESWEKKKEKREKTNRYTLPPGTLSEQVNMSGNTPCMDWNKSPKNPVAMYPTPTCADATMGAILNDNTKLITLKSGRMRKISNQGVSGSIGLARTVAMYPTPTCHNAKECDAPAEAIRNTPTLCHVARGGDKTQPRHLNPTWVEWLMGWPLGWTDLKPLGMDKYQSAQQKPGKYFRKWLDSFG